VSEPEPQELDPTYGEQEDTAETGLAAKIPLWRWYLRTTKGFGRSRSLFMPLGFLALGALAGYLGFPAIEELVGAVLLAIHSAFFALGDLFSAGPEASVRGVLDLTARRAATPLLALIWAAAISFRVALLAMPLPEREGDLGYVVPGSGFLARLWGIVGKRIYQIKKALVYLLSYLRDLNLQKLHLPLTLPALLVLAGLSLYLALENLLHELPARIESLRASTGWIPWTAGITSVVVILVLGIPMLVNSLVRAHDKSVQLRTRRAEKLIRRRTKGLPDVLFVFIPVAWMLLSLISGPDLPPTCPMSSDLN
jgi:hypothetical protein